MDIILHIETAFDSVFLINGSFFERGEVRTSAADILYITVLPLDAALSPYTVKMLGSRPLTSVDLCLSYKLSETHYYIRMLERYNYIYTTKKQQEPAVTSNVFGIFKLVKQKNFNAARALLTPELSSSIDNDALESFFASYQDIIENKGYIPAPFGSYFLITHQKEAKIHLFETKNGLIDNIVEYEART